MNKLKGAALAAPLTSKLLTNFGVALLKAFYPSSSVYHAPLSSIEWMTGATELHLELFSGRAGNELIAARARDFGIDIILRMYFIFHNVSFLGFPCL